MNRDDIIRAAQESGLIWGVTDAGIIASLEHFAALVAAYESEECAKLRDAVMLAAAPKPEDS